MPALASSCRILSGALLAAAVWLALVVHVALGSLPHNPLTPPLLQRTAMLALVPEGWAFFTRNPREAQLLVYTVGSAGCWQRFGLENGLPRYCFGIQRGARLFSMGLHSLLRRVPVRSWSPCLGNVNLCAERLRLTPLELSPTNAAELKLGTQRNYLIQVRDVVPWAWSRRVAPEQMPSRIVWLRLTSPP